MLRQQKRQWGDPQEGEVDNTHVAFSLDDTVYRIILSLLPGDPG